MLVSGAFVLERQCLKPCLQSTPSTSRHLSFSLDCHKDKRLCLLDDLRLGRLYTLTVAPYVLEGVVIYEAHLQPLFVHVYEHRPHKALERLCRREHADHLGAAPDLLVGALLDIVGPQSHVVPVGEVEVREGVRLRILEQLAGVSGAG